MLVLGVKVGGLFRTDLFRFFCPLQRLLLGCRRP